MAKDVNIHLKTTGSEKTKQDLDKTGQSAKRLGDKTAEGQKRAGAATEQGTKKLGAMSRLFNTLKTQVVGFVGAFLGIQAVVKVVTYLIQKLERVAELQKEIYEKSLQLAEIGQALEIQTGTIGKQQFWTKQAIELQKAGALRDPGVAGAMLTSMDIAFTDLGGIKDAQIRDLAKHLAPFIGALQLGPEEAAKLFAFGGTAGTEPTAEAYKQFFAEMHAAYTTSKSTDFGQFILGAQKGGTAYITAGGSLQQALSEYAAALAVMPTEQTAGTLLQQMSKIAVGQYPKARSAIEETVGVKFAEMTMDERMAALREHVRRIPEAQRAQVLADQEFPGELVTGATKLLSLEATQTLASASDKISQALSQTIDAIMQAYTDSMLGKERELRGEIAGRIAARGPDFANWQRRLKDAQSKFRDQNAISQDRWIKDSLEPYVIAIEQMQEEFLAKEGEVPTEGPAYHLWRDLYTTRNKMADVITGAFYPQGMAKKNAYELSRRFESYMNPQLAPQESPPLEPESAVGGPPPTPTPPPESAVGGPVSVNYDNRVINQTIFNPFVGMNKQDLRIEPPYLG